MGGATALWPLIDSLNPSADVLAESRIEVDLSGVEPGQRITVSWRGQPVFIDHRTPERIAAARADDDVEMIDPEPNSARVLHAEWLVVVGICTHLGCVPLGQREADPLGQ